MIQRYGQVTPTAGKIRRTYVKKAVPEGQSPGTSHTPVFLLKL
jgi:hypothetical protein